MKKNNIVVETYQYDNNGNRTQDGRNGGRYFKYDEEGRLTGVYSDSGFTTPIATYLYDANGSLETKNVGAVETEYDYAATGELRSVTLPGKTITYVHDPMGRRIQRSDGETTERYLWAGMNQGLLAVYNGQNVLKLRFEYAGMRMPVAVEDYRDDTEGRYYLAYDQVGSLRVVADTSGVIVKEVKYDAFGNVLSDSNTALEFPLGFAGGFTDHDTGLIRFGYRDYDPEIGRWTTKDPIGLLGGDTNLYGYGLMNPVRFTDANGLDVLMFGFGGAAGHLVGCTAGTQVYFSTQELDFGLYFHRGLGVATPALGLTMDASWSPEATSIKELNGTATTIGGSAGEGFTVGLEMTIDDVTKDASIPPCSRTPVVFTASAGVGILLPAPIPVEVHVFREEAVSLSLRPTLMGALKSIAKSVVGMVGPFLATGGF